MDRSLIEELENKLKSDIQALNDSRGTFDRIRGGKYSLDVFGSCAPQMTVIYTNRSIERKKNGRPVVADVKVSEQGLDGVIYYNHKKAGETIRRTIHGFIHQHSIPSGNLLYN